MYSFYGECGMTKLTYAQATKLVEQASQESLQNRNYRFGQALWNLLPAEMTKEFLGTTKDFFYWKDNAKVIETFYEYFVDNEIMFD